MEAKKRGQHVLVIENEPDPVEQAKYAGGQSGSDNYRKRQELLAKIKYTCARGNAFAQGIHDGGTLASKRKYQALALQFVAPRWDKNIVVTIALQRCVVC